MEPPPSYAEAIRLTPHNPSKTIASSQPNQLWTYSTNRSSTAQIVSRATNVASATTTFERCSRCLRGAYQPHTSTAVFISALLVSVLWFPIGCIAWRSIQHPNSKRCNFCQHKLFGAFDVIIMISATLSIVTIMFAISYFGIC